MPRLADLRQPTRQSNFVFTPDAGSDGETLISDVRGRMSPTQVVEQKLRRVLQLGEAVIGIPLSDAWRRLPR